MMYTIRWLYIDFLNGHRIFRHAGELYCRSREGYVYNISYGDYGQWMQRIANV